MIKTKISRKGRIIWSFVGVIRRHTTKSSTIDVMVGSPSKKTNAWARHNAVLLGIFFFLVGLIIYYEFERA